jgi:hypothetical protein|uniref:DUF7352 domain-containing protein n=1 Tax=Myoviridae sp. ctshb19 TaxID=2825194 RepID=A0A8S5UGL3_9CAUD|nr:MAG TPA: hypothetical protein [Myoviridae sp. ctshb19]
MFIGKFYLSISTCQTLEIPAPANIRSAIAQTDIYGRENVVLYAEMEEGAEIRKRQIRIYGTGQTMDEVVGNFIDTVSTEGGKLIWHVYDVTDYLAEQHHQ